MSRIAVSAKALADRAVEAARTLTRNGEAADEHQVVVERVAYAATEARVIHELTDTPAPLADGWRDRVALWQLYPLAAHACLFGGGYGGQFTRSLAALV